MDGRVAEEILWLGFFFFLFSAQAGVDGVFFGCAKNGVKQEKTRCVD